MQIDLNFPDESCHGKVVLADHIQELEPPPVDGGAELFIHHPHQVGVLGGLATQSFRQAWPASACRVVGR
jgi:hypothetical protein